jgi:hypothetical protein
MIQAWQGRSCVRMKAAILSASILAAIFAIGCGTQTDRNVTTVAPFHAENAVPPVASVAPFDAVPLPFRGRLAQGEPNALPPAVAKSLSNNSPITFSYREELTHDEYHLPLIVTALDPVTYIGAPLGDRSVTAFASLTIIRGDKVLGDYTAKARVSKSYTIYSEPTHAELESEARAAVREKIDDKLYQDADKLAQEAASGAPSIPGTLDR